MKQQLEAIRKAALDAISDAGKAEDLEALRVRYLGKKGELTAVLKQMGKLSAEERPVIGQLANEVRAKLEANIEEKSERARRQGHGAQAQVRGRGRDYPRQAGKDRREAPDVSGARRDQGHLRRHGL